MGNALLVILRPGAYRSSGHRRYRRREHDPLARGYPGSGPRRLHETLKISEGSGALALTTSVDG